MADITLNIGADAQQAQAAFRQLSEAAQSLEGASEDLRDSTKDNAEETAKATVKWQELANIAKAAVEAVVRFGVDAVKAFEAAERVQRQLNRAAGEYGDALGQQADALERLLGVDGDLIKESQTLLVQWGGVGAASNEVTQAVLNYAAATGQDAVAATQDLIRNVESGGVGLAKLGVHFTDTGDRGKNLANAVQALNEKFGGAAAADAQGLTPQVAILGAAFGDLVKDLGGAISEIIRASGIVPKLTVQIRQLRESLKDPSALLKKEETPEFIAQQVNYWREIASGHVEGFKDYKAGLKFTFEEAQAELAKWEAKMNPGAFNPTPAAPKLKLPGLETVTGATNSGTKGGGGAGTGAVDHLEEFSAELKAVLAQIAKSNQEHTVSMEEESERQQKILEDSIEAEKEQLKESLKIQQQAQEDELKSIAASNAQVEQLRESRMREELEAAQKKAQIWASAGDQIGAAFVNGLTDQLAKLSEGGEFDVALFVGDILAATFSIAAAAVGSAYGMPALGAAIGNLGAMGIRAGAAGVSAGERKARRVATYHSGAWVGDEIDVPRFHSGTWIGADERPAILQTGERVMSRSESHAAGGRSAVDAMAKGGRPGVQVFINAIDSKSAAESFETDLGKGLRRAQQSGRGYVPVLLGMGPR